MVSDLQASKLPFTLLYPIPEKTVSVSLPPCRDRGSPRYEGLQSVILGFFDDILELLERDLVSLAECQDILERLSIEFDRGQSILASGEGDEASGVTSEVVHPRTRSMRLRMERGDALATARENHRSCPMS